MYASRLALLTLCLILLASTPASAQERQAAPTQAEANAVTVAASATESGVRFTAPGAAAARVEVFAADGARLVDSDFRPGGILDLSAAQLPSDGEYLCVVTFRELSGRLRLRYAVVAVESGRASVRASAREGLSAAQAQTWEASRAALLSVAPSAVEDEGVAVVSEAEARALVVAAHDGRDGSLTSTAGALTLRTGDVLSGRGREHVRVTEDGKVGVGTDRPEATLDVAGDIRAAGSLHAAGGIRFDDGSALNSADGKLRLSTSAGAEQVPVDGAGMTNQVTKWTNGPAGTLGDSAITETGGNVGVGATNPFYRLVVGPNVSPGFVFTALSVSKGAGQSVSAFIGTPTQGIEFGWDQAGGRGLVNAPGTTPISFTQNGANERLRIHTNGFVGIGTSTPAAMLHVNGAVNFAGLRTFDNATSPNVVGGYAGNAVTANVVGATIGGGGNAVSLNRVTDDYGTVGGGFGNRAGNDVGSPSWDASYATVGGGEGNTASGRYSSVGGGIGNTASGSESSVGGGYSNTASGPDSSVGGGESNTASGSSSSVGGGSSNTASGSSSSVGGGSGNAASGSLATVPGGLSNTAAGDYSFAAGRRAKALNPGSFVWADSTDAEFSSSASNQFLIRAAGGVGINTNTLGATLDVAGSVRASGPLTVDANTLHVDAANNRVGVGTDAPLARLDVRGNIAVSVLGAAGATPLCRNASNEIATCTTPGPTAPQEVDAGGAAAAAALADTVRRQREQLEEQRRRIEQLEQRLAAFERLLTQSPAAGREKPRP